MIDPRLTRIFVLPILAVLVLAAFSVQDRPRGLRTFQAPDAFNGDETYTDLNSMAAAYPSRPTGGAADADAASMIEQRFAAAGLSTDRWTAAVRTERGASEDAVQVSGTSDGPSEGAIVVVAARDSVHAGARAELTGTATLLQLAGVLGKRRLEHPVTLISVSGTPGQAAYRQLASRLAQEPTPVRAVIVLGTLGTRDYLAPVTGLSDGPQFSSQRCDAPWRTPSPRSARSATRRSAPPVSSCGSRRPSPPAARARSCARAPGDPAVDDG